MNEIVEKILTSTDEELLNNFKGALESEQGLTAAEALEGLQEERDEIATQLAVYDRLIGIVRRYLEDGEAEG